MAKKKPAATDTGLWMRTGPIRSSTTTHITISNPKKGLSFDGDGEVRSRMCRGLLPLRVVLQMLT